MTERAKVKAGIQPPRPKKTQKKDDQIRELKARLAAFERPDEATVVSKEPLFMRGSSPPDNSCCPVNTKVEVR
ncbi:hypothetical protein BJ322DRAFT_1108197 [Thelephora terrestris]|uniref:Uncharacterized protein n=1 Tax=Thelephora terrestris TaxID=56493 RepID=A0A9P6HGA2_9AGAM|nr:hypothetical protein BJ322DRAFT_1108197 [Thelephora terrestris]